MLKVYTNNSYTDAWDYTITKAITLYGRWEEHTHTYDSYVTNGNSINRVCECGNIEGSLSISANENLVYNGESKVVNLTNTLNAEESEYTITYLKELNKDVWISVASPVNAGSYKAVLKYQGKTAELLFNIEKATFDLSSVKFDGKELVYDGDIKSLAVEGLPQGVTVEYLNNNQTSAGTYLVTAKFTVDSANYNEIDDMCAILQIKEEVKATSNDTKTNLAYAGIGCGGGIICGLVVGILICLTKRKRISLNMK